MLTSQRRQLATLAVLLLAAGWWVALRPSFLGGPVTYIVVHGHSMEPTFHPGDLVVVRKRNAYHAGEVIAFRVQNLVIHRIAGGNADEGFITQGDNKNAPDPYRPKPESIAGSRWLHFPGAGGWLARLKNPMMLGPIVGALTLLAVGGSATAKRSRRRRPAMRGLTHVRQTFGGGLTPSKLLVALAVLGVLTLVSAGLAVYAYRQDAETARSVERLRYSHGATFGYSASMKPCTLYPDGTFGPVLPPPPAVQLAGAGAATRQAVAPAPAKPPAPAPIYTKLLQRIDLQFSYSLGANVLAEAAGELSATARLTAKDGQTDGWSRTFELLPAQPFQGTITAVTIPLDFGPVFELIERVEKETEARPSVYELVVLPTVRLRGTLGGEPLDETYAPPFTMKLTATQLMPDAELRRSEPKLRSALEPAAARLGLPGGSMGVAFARRLGFWGTVLGLTATAGVAFMLIRRLSDSEEEKVRLLHGALLVGVTEANVGDVGQRVRVASLRDLVRLAQRDGGMILHQTGAAGSRYFVHHGAVAYEYAGAGPAPEPGETAARSGSGSHSQA